MGFPLLLMTLFWGTIKGVEYKVTIKRRVRKLAAKMPQYERKKFDALAADLRASGPVQSSWPNYSKLSATEYHCHLTYHWVACWRLAGPESQAPTTAGGQTKQEEKTIEIEVYYAGSREDAPY